MSENEREDQSSYSSRESTGERSSSESKASIRGVQIPETVRVQWPDCSGKNYAVAGAILLVAVTLLGFGVYSIFSEKEAEMITSPKKKTQL